MSRRTGDGSKWLEKGLELLDRFERGHETTRNTKYTLCNLAELLGVTRQTLYNDKRFHSRYLEVRDIVKRRGNGPISAEPGDRLNQEQRIRRLERENAELTKALEISSLRWMAVCRLADREGWHGFEFRLKELLDPSDPRWGDTIQVAEE